MSKAKVNAILFDTLQTVVLMGVELAKGQFGSIKFDEEEREFLGQQIEEFARDLRGLQDRGDQFDRAIKAQQMALNGLKYIKEESPPLGETCLYWLTDRDAKYYAETFRK